MITVYFEGDTYSVGSVIAESLELEDEQEIDYLQYIQLTASYEVLSWHEINYN